MAATSANPPARATTATRYRPGGDRLVRALRTAITLGVDRVVGPPDRQLPDEHRRGDQDDPSAESSGQRGQGAADGGDGHRRQRMAGAGQPAHEGRPRRRASSRATRRTARRTGLDGPASFPRSATGVIVGIGSPKAVASAGCDVDVTRVRAAAGRSARPGNDRPSRGRLVPRDVAAPAHDRDRPRTAVAGHRDLFLLRPGEESAWHRVASDELWLWQGGGPVELTVGGD